MLKNGTRNTIPVDRAKPVKMSISYPRRSKTFMTSPEYEAALRKKVSIKETGITPTIVQDSIGETGLSTPNHNCTKTYSEDIHDSLHETGLLPSRPRPPSRNMIQNTLSTNYSDKKRLLRRHYTKYTERGSTPPMMHWNTRPTYQRNLKQGIGTPERDENLLAPND